MTDAVVVGSGPNGLAAAVTLARHGLAVTVLEAAAEPGGGARSGEATLPGLLHDHCSAVHPFGVASPLLRSPDLARHGLAWAWPEVDLAHPLDGGDAAVAVRSVRESARALGPDADAWLRVFAGPSGHFDALAADALRPLLRVPRHPLRLARFGFDAVRPATLLARRWRTDRARALFAGAAAHAFQPLERPLTSAVGLLLLAAAHHRGWPVARGGSGRITDALAARLAELGGRVETGRAVRSLAELRPCPLVLLDVAPGAAADLCGEDLPPRVRRAYRRWRYGPAAFRIDFAVQGGVPWRHEDCRRAGTVHVGGTLEEIAHAERETARGRMPERPFVLVAQQYLADPGRSRGDVHPVYAYAHVPHGYDGDASGPVLGQLERFAPGFRERVLATATVPTPDLPRRNANLVGGDIGTGANTPLQTVLRPRAALDPYATGIPGVYLCSAATPPGAGVHGLCGLHAARSALRHLGIAPVD
ncbi:phytoene desaturase family protein [Streptomyces sp. NRRL S-350]|uniref:phytoene desaturase family protein n=1 Tax=Streptomyces sp. NRRL S-350 TaxID=1463902 RepID=UPI0004C259D3|nr:NAD(P)/FAD-dependent oxidoreductase [Streptomyces sp. NRRL S-350]